MVNDFLRSHPRLQRFAARWLRPVPVAVTVLVIVAVALILSNTLSTSVSGLVHNEKAKPAVATPSFKAAAAPTAVCGDTKLLSGPATAPDGAVTVPAGDNSGVNFGQADATYWFAPGKHTLGAGQYTQITPGNGATFTGAPGAVLDGQQKNAYAFAGPAQHVTVSYLTIENFGAAGGNQNEGVMNHDSSSYWTIDHNTIRGNAGAGTMLGSHNKLTDNCLTDNQQYGFNAYAPDGITGLTIDHNEISGNDTYDWEAKIDGCGCTGGGKFWDVNGAVVTNNLVTDNKSVGLWADTNNRSFQISGNYISGNYGNGIIYEISYNAVITGNTFLKNGIGSGPKNPGFPTGAIYISESGGDKRVPGKYSGQLKISGNTFVDNWGGVILWENADRFCNSPSNTSTGFCTLVNPGTVTLKSCNQANIAKEPYLGDCRWKTQNVSVDHNTFDFTASAVSPQCSPATGCGFQGLFSQYGTYPSWSPYKATAVEQSITFDQGNRFTANKYTGPWQFMVKQQDTVVPWGKWIAAPYQQDQGSTARGTAK
jgi:hypothetical protein